MSKLSVARNLLILTTLFAMVAVFFTLQAVPAQAWGVDRGEIDRKIDPAAYAHLKAQLQAQPNGRLRLIVRLDVPFDARSMALGKAEAFEQRLAIDDAQLRVESALRELNAEVLHNFEYIPFSVVMLDEAALDLLLSLPFVKGVSEDTLEEASLAQSVPLINADDAWASGYSGAGQVVAILDTGVDKTHPFLAGKVVSEACYSSVYSYLGYNDILYYSISNCPGGAQSSTAIGSAMPYAGACPSGQCDHGTHVAGIAAGKGSSFSGVAKDASIIAIQVFARFDYYYGSPAALSWSSDQVKGLERVFELSTPEGDYIPNIAAVNISIGGGTYENYCDTASGNPDRKYAIDLLRAAGIATVISSGNNYSPTGISSPACISSAVSVGATTKGDIIASYSNSASFLNILAPGGILGNAIYSSLPYAGYGYMAGTSMAAPHVTGAWAVIKSREPKATVDEVLSVLTSTGIPILDTRNTYIKPRLNVFPAVNTVLAGPTTLSATATSQQRINLTWSDNSSIESGYRVERSPDGSSGWTQLGADLPANTHSFSDYPLTCGITYHYRVTVFNAGSVRTSNPVNQTTQACALSPKPVGVGAESLSVSAIQVEWSDVGDYETGYRIERSANGSNGWTELGTVGQDVIAFNDLGLFKGSTFYYRVSAFNSAGNSPTSNVVSASTYPYGLYIPLLGQ